LVFANVSTLKVVLLSVKLKILDYFVIKIYLKINLKRLAKAITGFAIEPPFLFSMNQNFRFVCELLPAARCRGKTLNYGYSRSAILKFLLILLNA